MLTGFSTLACPDWTWEEILHNGSAWGYDGVEVRLLMREVDLLSRPEFAPDQLAKRRAELEVNRFRIAGLASSVRFDDADAQTRQEQVRVGRAYIDLARELGGGFVRVFGDVLPPRDQPEARKATLGNIADGLRSLGDHAAECQIQVLLETHGDFSDSHLAADLMRRVDHPAVGILWDTHHPWRFCGEPLAESMTRMRPWVRHTHWKDSVTQSNKSLTAEMQAADRQASQLMRGHRSADYVLLGEGEFPARECLQVLQQSGYNGWYSYEWEKAWHPEIEPPEVALPPFPAKLRELSR